MKRAETILRACSRTPVWCPAVRLRRRENTPQRGHPTSTDPAHRAWKGVFKQALRKVVILAGLTLAALAVAKANPYQSIIQRNAFRLKFPLPSRAEAVLATLPRRIFLTGLTSLGEPKAFFEWPEPGSDKQMKRSPGMRKDQELDGVRVLDIDVEKGDVRIMNGTVEMTLNFEKDGVKSMRSDAAAQPRTIAAVPPSAPPLVRPGVPGDGGVTPLPPPPALTIRPQVSYDQSVLSVAVATELSRLLVERGEHPPFPPTELTPDPPKLPGAIVQPQIETDVLPVPNVTVPRRIR